MGDGAEKRLAAYIQPLPVYYLALCLVLWDFHNGTAQPSPEKADGCKCNDVFFISFVYLIANVDEKLEIALTFCGISEAVLGPFLCEGSLSV